MKLPCAARRLSRLGDKMTAPKICVTCLLGPIALLDGLDLGFAVGLWLLVAIVPPLLVFVWWMVDRAALERRVRRLEARSEIGDERRVAAHTDLTNVEHRLHEIEARVALAGADGAGATAPGVRR